MTRWFFLIPLPFIPLPWKFCPVPAGCGDWRSTLNQQRATATAAQSQTLKGVPLPSRKTPHFGHLPGCFHTRRRWRADTGQTGLK